MWSNITCIGAGSYGAVCAVQADKKWSFALKLQEPVDNNDFGSVIERTASRLVAQMRLPSFLDYYGTMATRRRVVLNSDEGSLMARMRAAVVKRREGKLLLDEWHGLDNEKANALLGKESGSHLGKPEIREALAKIPEGRALVKHYEQDALHDYRAECIVMELAVATGVGLVTYMGQHPERVRAHLFYLCYSLGAAQSLLDFWHYDIKLPNIVGRRPPVSWGSGGGTRTYRIQSATPAYFSVPFTADDILPAFVDFGNASYHESAFAENKRPVPTSPELYLTCPSPEFLFEQSGITCSGEATDVFTLGLVVLDYFVGKSSVVWNDFASYRTEFAQYLRSAVVVGAIKNPEMREHYFEDATLRPEHLAYYCGYLYLWKGLDLLTPLKHWAPMGLQHTAVGRALKDGNTELVRYLNKAWDEDGAGTAWAAIKNTIVLRHGSAALSLLREMLHPNKTQRTSLANILSTHPYFSPLRVPAESFVVTGKEEQEGRSWRHMGFSRVYFLALMAKGGEQLEYNTNCSNRAETSEELEQQLREKAEAILGIKKKDLDDTLRESSTDIVDEIVIDNDEDKKKKKKRSLEKTRATDTPRTKRQRLYANEDLSEEEEGEDVMVY